MGMAYPEIWGAIANHSGDAYFDFVYGAEWPAVLTHLQSFAKPQLKTGKQSVTPQLVPGEDDGRVRRFLTFVAETPPNGEKPLSNGDVMTLMLLAIMNQTRLLKEVIMAIAPILMFRPRYTPKVS